MTLLWWLVCATSFLLLCSIFYFYWFSPSRRVVQKLEQTCAAFVKKLYTHYPDDPRVQRLYFRHQKTGYKLNIKPETYTINKEQILFCVEDHRQNRQVHQDFNLLMFVALHELGHVMSVQYGHTEEFWQNFRFLLQVATEWKFYDPVDYQFSPTPYCKMIVNDNPFFTPPILHDILWQLQNTI